MPTIRIDLSVAERRGYDVVIEAGGLDALAAHARAMAPAHRYVVIADTNVGPLWGDRARAGFPSAFLLQYEAGERFKTRETWARMTDRMLEEGLGRDSAVIALGGGVTGDLAGFIAATYMRGIPVVQVPTTLLAMLDASIGGKTGVDVGAGKNLVGAFHQPAGVLIDPVTLTTLPREEFVGGLAEAVKHGAIADAGYLEWIAANRAALLALDAPSLEQLIEGSVRIKGEHVAADERESGRRAALNFGHTIGHALEHASSFTLHHGHAVAIGMVAEAQIGEGMGITETGTASRLTEVLRAVGLPVRLPAGFALERIVAPMGLDKKARGGNVRSTMLTRIGETGRTAGGDWTFEFDATAVQQTLIALAEP